MTTPPTSSSSTAPSRANDTDPTDRGGDQPRFKELGVPKKLAEVLRRDGIHRAFPIQTASLPAALAGDDLCGRAPTGSGKTLAFAIPVVENVRESRPHHPGALLLTPTRELANQVHDTILPLAKARGRWVASFYGGTSVKRDVARLRKGVDIVVGTPGRLEDLIQQGELHLDEVRVVVLDEADRMADMGFLPVVKRILDQTHRDRQTLLFSATLDGDVDVLVRRYQHDPVRVEVDQSEEEQGSVNHLFWGVDRLQRRQLTTDVLSRSGSTIVFTRTKRGADRLSKQLSKGGLRTAAIHGNRSQNQRERALAQFAEGDVTALIATDVAARGIHVDDVDTVLHYDLPATDKDYVHRSGRTGRAGRDGTVVSLVCEDQHGDLRSLQRGLDVGSGTHPVDLDLLSADSVPAPGQRPGASNGQGSRQASRNGSSGRRNGSSRGSSEGRSSQSSSRNGGSPSRSDDDGRGRSNGQSTRTTGGARPRSRRRS